MTTINRVLRINQEHQAVVDEAGSPSEEFVVLTDEHGGVHLLPVHFYERIQKATDAMSHAVEDRRAYLRSVKAGMGTRHNEGDFAAGLTGEVRGFSWLRQRLGQLI